VPIDEAWIGLSHQAISAPAPRARRRSVNQMAISDNS
jgi:hypothetical protein